MQQLQKYMLLVADKKCLLFHNKPFQPNRPYEPFDYFYENEYKALL